jgi:hypothetical protein
LLQIEKGVRQVIGMITDTQYLFRFDSIKG